MRLLALGEVLALHRRVIAETGGAAGLRDLRALAAAVAQPRATCDGVDLYPDPISKPAALCVSIVSGHPFVDGNKRVGHLAVEVTVGFSGCRIDAPIDEQEAIMLRLAPGQLRREELTEWLRRRVVRIAAGDAE